MSGEIITREELDPVVVYSGGLDEILKRIETATQDCPKSAGTPEDRDAIKSLAYKVTRSKTLIDDLGKELGEEARKKVNAINADRQKARSFLDALKDRVRKPLTNWEAKQEERRKGFEAKIAGIVFAGQNAETNWQNLMPEDLTASLAEVESGAQEKWFEFAEIACPAAEKSAAQIKVAIENRAKHDAEQAELAALRAEKEKREREDAARKAEEDRAIREERIRTEAAASAATAERKRLEAERRAQEEQERLACAAEEKRKANRAHRAQCNRSASGAIATICSLTEGQAQAVVAAIAKGQIPHATMNY
jgi:hypothetical protein